MSTRTVETPHSVRCRCAHCRAQLLLRAASIEQLLTKAYQLTHRMHADKSVRADDLRAQRDLISAEIIRRTTEGSTS